MDLRTTCESLDPSFSQHGPGPSWSERRRLEGRRSERPSSRRSRPVVRGRLSLAGLLGALTFFASVLSPLPGATRAAEAQSESHLSYPTAAVDVLNNRVIDTRKEGYQRRYQSTGKPLGSGKIIRAYFGEAHTPVLNVAVVGATRPGRIEVYPCDRGAGGTSTVNFKAGEIISNTVVVAPDADWEICFRAVLPGARWHDGVHVIVDEHAGVKYLPGERPTRLYDSRGSGDPRVDPPLAKGRYHRLTGLKYNRIYALNITAINPAYAGTFVAYGCDNGHPSGYRSAGYEARKVQAGAALVRPDVDGHICIYSSQTTHFVVDQMSRMTTLNSQLLAKPRRVGSSSGTRVTQLRFKLPSDYDGRSALLQFQVSGARGNGSIEIGACNNGWTFPNSQLNYDAASFGVGYTVVAPDAQREVCIDATSAAYVSVHLVGWMNQRRSQQPKYLWGCPKSEEIYWMPEFNYQKGCFKVKDRNSNANKGTAFVVNNLPGYQWTLPDNHVVYFDRSVKSVVWWADNTACCGWGIGPMN